MLTLQQTKTLIETKYLEISASDPFLYTVFPNTDNPYDLNNDDDVICKITLNMGDVVGEEKDHDGVARRVGVLSLSFFGLWGSGSGRLLSVAETFERAFHKLEINSEDGDVYFMNAYTTGGFLTENTKFCYVMNVPFWVWVGN